MENNKQFEQIMKSWLSSNTQARQSPSGMSDIKYKLEEPRNCPSTSSATTYGYPYSPSDNSASTADGYAPVNVFAQQQQQGPNGLQYNLPPLDFNPSCSKYAQCNQTNVTMDFSAGGTTTQQTQPDELKRILQQLQQPQQQQQQQPNQLSPQEQLLKMTQGLSLTNGGSSNTYGNLANGGDIVNLNNNLDALTINHQTINQINHNMFINGGASPAYSQQPAYSPGSMQSPSPVQFQQQQQFQPDQQFQLPNPMMNMINHNQLSPNMNGGISPAYQQSNFLPVPMHSPSPGQLPQQQQQYQEQLPYNQQQQQQPQQLQYQQVEPFDQSENPNISDLIETMDGVLVKDLIARNQNAGN